MGSKKVLVIGNGGREHAIAHAFATSPSVAKVYALPGNAGTRLCAENVSLPVTPPFTEVIAFAKEHAIDMTFVGPEIPLVDGIVDAFTAASLSIVGPTKDGAQLEGSKVFTKTLLMKYGIPTAGYDVCATRKEAHDALAKRTPPFVMKADGLAAGKGVIIASDMVEAERALDDYFTKKAFGSAGDTVVVEDFLEGEEASILAFTDGTTSCLLTASQDHKRAYDNDEGPNTGGMGAYSPLKLLSQEQTNEIKTTIIDATVDALKSEGITYKGVLYAGLMIDAQGRPSVVEFNCRLGDPECQVVLPLLKTDLYAVCEAIVEERLADVALETDTRHAVTVVAASKGYPGAYEKGVPIEGDLARMDDDLRVYHAGVAYEGGVYRTTGGRVLAVTAIAEGLAPAIEKAYAFLDKNISFDGMHVRRDIGRKGL